MFLSITKLHREYKSRTISFDLLGSHAYYARHPEDIAHIVRTQAHRYCKPVAQMERIRAFTGEGLFALQDGEKHEEAKAVLDPAFRAEFIKGLVPAMASVAAEMVDTLLAKAGPGHASDVEVEDVCRRTTLDVLGRTSMCFDFQALKTARGESSGVPLASSTAGSPPAYADAIKLWDAVLGPAMLLAFGMGLPDTWLPGYQGYLDGLATFNELVKTMVATRRAAGVDEDSKDLLGLMLRAQQQGSTLMTDQHIRDELMVFMLAGADTAAETLAFAFYELSQRPDLQRQLVAEQQRVMGGRPLEQMTAEDTRSLKLLTAVINETLRMYPAATDLARDAAVDDVLGGHFIPKGARVIINLFSLHRHEDFWPRPDEWLPERWLPEHQDLLGPRSPDAFLPFSSGGRACIGRYMAVLEVQVLLSVLLQRVTLAPPRAPDAPAMELTQAFTLKSGQGILVSVTPRA